MIDPIREKFEIYAKEQAMFLDKKETGRFYNTRETDEAWSVWKEAYQACAADLLPAIREMRDEFRRICMLNPLLPIGSPDDGNFFIKQAHGIATQAIAQADKILEGK